MITRKERLVRKAEAIMRVTDREAAALVTLLLAQNIKAVEISTEGTSRTEVIRQRACNIMREMVERLVEETK